CMWRMSSSFLRLELASKKPQHSLKELTDKGILDCISISQSARTALTSRSAAQCHDLKLEYQTNKTNRLEALKHYNKRGPISPISERKLVLLGTAILLSEDFVREYSKNAY
ncbi:unnamed protein product, partial [Calicophoron daubneyi]